MQAHLALIGDSIFDNAPYVDPGHSVRDHIHPLLDGWKVTLMAVDGDTTRDIAGQLEYLPPDITHLALSIGGNDALQCVSALQKPCNTLLEALESLGTIQSDFRSAYAAALEPLRTCHLPLVICTIYEQVPGLRQELKTALALFNEVILSEASRHQLPVLDLRHLCTEPEDFSALSPIEPSSLGGRKIATALANILREWDATVSPGRLYVQ